jgi:putative ABC transport system ATP-binding protein
VKHDILKMLGTFVKHERQLLVTISLYAVAVAVLSLIVPLTVQELVNTFAFSIQPIMVVTLVIIMAGILGFVSIFKVLQFFVTDLIERRNFVRMTLAFARIFPTIQEKHFRPEYTSRFFETIFMQRALSVLLVDTINVTVGGITGMILLIFYHPFFLVIDLLLILAVGVIGLLGKGGFLTTLHMSNTKYDTYHWFQEVADNLDHFKVSQSRDLILHKADLLAHEYVEARISRFRVLVRQYIGSLTVQVVMHTGLLGMAGWLVSIDELTIGQLVAAEVIMGSLLVNLDSVSKRIYVFFYFLVALTELYHVLSLPKDYQISDNFVSLPELPPQGLRLSISHLSGLPHPWPHAFELSLDLKPGEKWAFLCGTESQRLDLSRLLAGLDAPPHGSIRYNGINVRDLHPDDVNSIRALVLSRHLSLFEGTLLENITLGRKDLSTEDLLWALEFVELQGDIEHFPNGLQTMVEFGRSQFTPNQILKILLARSVILRPKLLVVDGGLHEIQPGHRENILSRICRAEQPWTAVIVTTDANIKTFVQQSLLLV